MQYTHIQVAPPTLPCAVPRAYTSSTCARVATNVLSMATRERFYEESSFFVATESCFDAVHIRIEAAGVVFARHNYNRDILFPRAYLQSKFLRIHKIACGQREV